MKIESTSIPGVMTVAPVIHRDHRGYFLETWRSKEIAAALGVEGFVQGNLSNSVPFCLRGLHYQIGPNAQGKLVRCLKGRIYDVAADIRPWSPTFKKWIGVWLDDQTHKALYVPPGFAHGFMTAEAGATVSYECTTTYEASSDRGIRWDDPELHIGWPMGKPGGMTLTQPVLSPRDIGLPHLRDAELPTPPAKAA